MPAILRYFSIGADDVARARAFYERAGLDVSPVGPAGPLSDRLAGVLMD